MNGSELDRLGKLIEEGTVPEWVRTFVQEHRDQIVQALSKGQPYDMKGPSGQVITIEAEREAAA